LGEFEGPSSTQINLLGANPIATRRIRVPSRFDDVHGIVTTTRYVRHNIKIRTMPTCHVCAEHQDQASMSILFPRSYPVVKGHLLAPSYQTGFIQDLFDDSVRDFSSVQNRAAASHE
jgi:hypothetical protein